VRDKPTDAATGGAGASPAKSSGRQPDLKSHTKTVMKNMGVATLFIIAAATGTQAQDMNQNTATDGLSIGQRMWPPVSNG
jgi:hypothetical protein